MPNIFSRLYLSIAASLSKKERRAFVFLIVLFIVGVIWSITAYVDANTELQPEEGGIYREGAVTQPRSINPILERTNDADMNIGRLVYSGLLKLTDKDGLRGDLAENYEVSADKKTYTVFLKKNIKWHDGEDFDAADVIFTIKTIQNPETKSPAAPSFRGVAVTKIDDHAVEFKLKEPYAPFIYQLTIGIAPEHIWSGVDPKTMVLAEQNLKPIGTGPFKFKKIRKRSLGEITAIELERYDGYHDRRPYLDGITFTFYQNNEEMLRELSGKKIDGVSFLPPDFVKKAQRIPKTNIVSMNMPQYFAVFFNQGKNEVLADKSVRTALNISVDRERLIREAMAGQAIRVDAPIAPGFIGYLDNANPAEYAPDKTRQNLDEAGWKDEDGDGIREKGGKKLAFKLTTTDAPEYAKTAELLAEMWKDIGAAVELESHSVGTVQTEIIKPRNYDAFLYGEVVGADPDPYEFWHSTKTRDPGINLALYKDDESDKLLAEARQITDTEERSEKYKRFQERLIESVPAVFLYNPYYNFALRSYVGGERLEAVALPSQRFNTISTWYIKTKSIWKNDR